MRLDTKRQWELLLKNFPLSQFPTITLSRELLIPGIRVRETLREASKETPILDYIRYFNGKRSTDIDKLGFIGLTTLDLSSHTLYLTEGISDFLSLKSFYPHLNVLGKTKLNLSKLQLHFIKQLFTSVVIISDNDTTGITKAFAHQTLLHKQGVKSQVYLSINKDITIDLLTGLSLKL